MPNRMSGRTLLQLCIGALLFLLITACDRAQEDLPPAPAPAPQAALFADAAINADVTGKWARSCALCHVTGEGGAPRTGIREEWAPRLAQGEEGLMNHILEGFNNMPPLGYCMSCEREDFRAMTRLMIGSAL